MAKKLVGVYVPPEDIDWIERYPFSDTTSGSVALAANWALKQFQRGLVTALEKLDLDERRTIIDFASKRDITPDISAGTLVIALSDWFRYSTSPQGSLVVGRLDNHKFGTLMKKCEELSPSEVIGLLAWARGYSASGNNNIDEYIAKG